MGVNAHKEFLVLLMGSMPWPRVNRAEGLGTIYIVPFME